ncbi:ABC transporter permease, partial [Phytoactinopolyspora endophytica]|uniref:ABC transporter permease n=1 Tax=Phytoactinopolyspora endophytica TaxID=1642495 RepID=UPI00197B0BA5
MTGLAWAMTRLGAIVAVCFAVVGGSAFVTAVAVLAESGLRAHATVDRLAGADVVVSARQTLPQDEDLPAALPERAVVPADLIDRLADLPGVAWTIGDLSFPAAVIDGAGDEGHQARTAGHGWSSAKLLGPHSVTGRAPSGPDEVALGDRASAGHRVGDLVRIVAAGQTDVHRVSALVDGPGIFFPEDMAIELAGRDGGPRRDTVDLVALGAAPGTSPDALAADVRRAVGDRFEVATGDARGDAEVPGIEAARMLLVVLAGSVAGIALLVVAFVIGGALSVSVNRQRHELALMRAIGATGRQVRRLVAVQSLTGAMLTAPAGVLIGYLLAGRLRAALVSLGVLPDELPLIWSPLPAVAALLLTLAVVRVSAWAAAFKVSRMPPTEAVAESQSEPRHPSVIRTRAGLLLILASLPISIVPLLVRAHDAAAATASASILAVIGLALAGPWLAATGGDLLAGRLPRRTTVPTWLAVHNSRGYALRFSAAVAALAMVVTLALSYTLTQTTVMSAATADVAAGTHADRALTAPDLGGIPDGLLADVRALPGVSAAIS